jgi:hypothetical protein
MARPPKQIDEKQVEQMAAIGCSEKEIGLIVGCSDRPLERRFVGALKRGWAREETMTCANCNTRPPSEALPSC